ncbi:MAG TPA: DUF1722 domain-containing protein [Desulfurivibrio alkaliphilus]|uniref:DUF1722 domain-containing protein n=1 Tax=Desulfurivibrio alkaliphilus TaxID=427923 RepID=A0A7C2TH46_9BACT|nr:DUF1722 domain-containing protein [Desulfurivibrio alkaliphilus]
MRVWDVDPGYLNRSSLLGEHRELHGIVAILKDGKRGYSRHPETLRWRGYGWALSQRHRLLAAEMALRGYVDRSPVRLRANPRQWPEIFLNPPGEQLLLLAGKYRDRPPGRIPLPRDNQQLWAQHKYSVLARDPAAYRRIGRELALSRDGEGCDELALRLVQLLRRPPEAGHLRNAIQHMWGYVAGYSQLSGPEINRLAPATLLREIQRLALIHRITYLAESTALGELAAWPGQQPGK